MWSIYGNWFPGMDLLLVGITCAFLQNTLQFIALMSCQLITDNKLHHLHLVNRSSANTSMIIATFALCGPF